MKSDEEILASAISGGLIGYALGALITDDKNGATGALARAAILASYKAYERARQTDVPLLIEVNNGLYEIQKDGSRKLIKIFPKNTRHLPKHFKLN